MAPQPRYLDPATLQKLASLELVAKEVVEGVRIGMHRSPLRGLSTEFSHHRQYVVGDPLRHVDWRVYARTSRYYLKLFESETDFTANLLLDASSSMQYSSGAVTKLEYAKFLAASLAHLIVTQRDAAGLAIFDSALRQYIEPTSNPNIVMTMARELEKVGHEPKTDVAALLHEFGSRIRKRGFVVVFSDLFDDVDGFARGLDHLRFRGHNVIVFHILDPHELEFPFDGTCKFKGLEDFDEVVTRPARVRAAYLEELRRYLADVRQVCDASQVDYHLISTATPVDVALVGSLVERMKASRA